MIRLLLTVALLLTNSGASSTREDWHKRMQHAIDLHAKDLGCDSALAIMRDVLHEVELLAPTDSLLLLGIHRELRNVFSSRGETDSVSYHRSVAVTMLLNTRLGELATAQNLLIEEARIRFGEGDSISAKYLIQRAEAESLITPPSKTGDPRWVCHNWGEYNYSISNYAVAEGMFLRAVVAAVEMGGEDDWVTNEMVTRLGNLYNELGRYDEALTLQRRALHIREHIFGVDSPKVAGGLNNLALIYQAKDQFDSAAAILERAQAICEKSEKCENRTLVTIKSNLGETYRRQGRYNAAEVLCLQVLESRRNDPNRSLAALAENDLANLYREIGRYRDAIPLLEDALAIRKEIPLLQDHTVATNCADLARVYIEESNFVAAERLLRDAASSHRKSLGDDHPELALDLISLGELLLDQQRFLDAKSAFEEALAILQRSYSGPHTTIAQVYTNFARLAIAEGNHELAQNYVSEAKSLWRQFVGANHPDYANALAVFSDLELDAGDNEQAQRLADECMQVRRTNFGKQHPDVAAALELQGRINLSAGHPQIALEKFREATLIYETLYGKDFPTLATCWEGQALCLIHLGKPAGAFRNAILAISSRYKLFLQNAFALSERNALEYAANLQRSRDILLSSYFAIPNPTKPQMQSAAELVLQTKCLASEEIARRDNFAIGDSTTAPLLEDLRLCRFKLANLFVRGPQSNTAAAFRQQLDSLSLRAEQLESQLSLYSAGLGRRKDERKSVSSTLSQQCSASTLLLEYIKYRGGTTKTGGFDERYALVSVTRTGVLALAELGSVDKIDDNIAAYQSHLNLVCNQGFASNEDNATFSRVATSLGNQLIPESILESGSYNELVIAPDDNIALVSFATLVRSGRYLVEDHDIRYVNTARELLYQEGSRPKRTGLLALGDPDFDLKDNTRHEMGIQTASVVDPLAQSRRVRSNRSACVSFDSLRLERLPAAGREVLDIAANWKQFSEGKSLVLTGGDATEESFKQLSEQVAVVHLATHSFVVSAKCREFADRVGPAIENPLLLSGLYFAGANNSSLRTEAGLEDGVLTAAEIALLDLRGVEMVVLSSCQSGLGSILAGEGVFGLRRAFRLAGVWEVVASLWQVPDEQTALLMKRLYGLSSPEHHKILSQVQRELIKSARGQNRPDHPFAWGSFIVVGNN